MFNNINVNKINDNVFDLIGKQWMLITAGNTDLYNTMTAAWGSFGYLWNFPVTQIFIRPQRHTFDFVENHTHYTLCFFENKHKDILTYCGTHSGKDVDKATETGLIPMATENGNVYFEQARLVFECEKVYFDDIKPENFKDGLIQRNFPNKDYHRMYFGKVIKCMVRQNINLR